MTGNQLTLLLNVYSNLLIQKASTSNLTNTMRDQFLEALLPDQKIDFLGAFNFESVSADVLQNKDSNELVQRIRTSVSGEMTGNQLTLVSKLKK
uniref:Uncharacterized protein n=1 Tax=Panagrolaimus sp. JU765 TaxID=591449 RepID=A0AC34R2S7_9BILA